ncbi:hypothetical protein DPMN_071191 [Dreissena polymorpha]|uniref:Uncharacterized protein n=1 Tax=Dreissena polymorpha TaxID=45954 RepID=A0A9D3Z710_DREPO|nr:hypothetical protein DPMN_071191 [Dreissena polymorpha]
MVFRYSLDPFNFSSAMIRKSAVDVCVKVLGNRVIVSSPYPGQVKEVSLVQGISRFLYVYKSFTAFAVHRVYYIGEFSGNLVSHIVGFACGIAELFGIHHVRTDCPSL